MLAGEGKDEYQTVLGKTISTDDFYEGQVFLDFSLERDICTVIPNAMLVFFLHTIHI